MKLETALDLIHEAIRIEEENPDMEPYYCSDKGIRNSTQRHDDCLRMARKVLLDNIVSKKHRTKEYRSGEDE